MPISFSEIPSNLRIPFFAVEISNENANQGANLKAYRALVIGQRLTAGTVQKNIPVRVSSKGQADTFFGRGSMLSGMVKAFVANNSFTEMWAVALDDDPAGVAATATMTFTGPATGAGTLFVYIGGQRFTVGVNSADSITVIATALVAAIAANADLPVTAANTAGVVTLTAKHKGVVGNKIDAQFNYNTGDAFPAGVNCVVTPFVGGTANPDISAALAALGDVQYDAVAFPYTDANSLTDMEAELQDRWGAMRMIEGLAYTADNGSMSALGTLGDSRNSPFATIMNAFGVPNPVWEVAAAYAAAAIFNIAIDPARQLRTIPLVGILPPKLANQFTNEERNLLLFDGITTFTVDASGVVRIERAITTYKTNAVGADDPSYLDIMTPYTVAYLRYDLRTTFMLKYPRHKLADDGTRYGAGQSIITPKIAKAECIAKFRQWEDLGLVEGADQFKADLIVERNAQDPNRLDFGLSPNIVNNFMIGAAKIDFLLQANTLTS